MEYTFGTNGSVETLRTKGDSHTGLTGYHQVERAYADQTITDRFRVVDKLDSKEDAEGNCYDWYEIDRHYRLADKTGPVAATGAKNAANIDYLSMMSGIDLPDEEESDNG